MDYVICSCARSGSTLLAEALTGMGAGRPEEYFDRRIHNGRIKEHVYREDFMLPTPRAFVERIRQEHTVGGMFAVKAHYPQLAAYPEILDNIGEVFPDAKYIAITRRNILRQSVSASRALQTKAWTSHLPEGKRPRFNLLSILKAMIFAAQDIENWEKFYARNGIRPLRIVYEDLEDDYEGTMRRVVEFLGISGEIPAPPIQKQADAVSEQWVERFIAFFQGKGKISGCLSWLARRW